MLTFAQFAHITDKLQKIEQIKYDMCKSEQPKNSIRKVTHNP